MPRSRRDVERILKKKGFTPCGGDHEYFVLYRNEKKTAVNTKISRGSHKDISDGLLNAMMQQIRLTKKDFNRYFDCTMSKEEYIQYLIDNGHIED